MAGKAIVIHDPVFKDEIELTDKESKQYQEILSTAVQLEENHNKAIAEIQKDYKKFLKRNDYVVLLQCGLSPFTRNPFFNSI